MIGAFKKFLAELKDTSPCPDIARELDFEER
jgi:hypothetical protein